MQESPWNATRRKPFAKNSFICCLSHCITFVWTSLSKINVRLWGLSFEIKGREYRIVLSPYCMRAPATAGARTQYVRRFLGHIPIDYFLQHCDDHSEFSRPLFLIVTKYKVLKRWTMNCLNWLCRYVIWKPEARVHRRWRTKSITLYRKMFVIWSTSGKENRVSPAPAPRVPVGLKWWHHI
jgi:hypothetical protein